MCDGADPRKAMKKILTDIQSGAFADEWMAECRAGKPRMREMAGKEVNHPIEKIGPQLRDMMSWMQREADSPVSSGTKDRAKAVSAAPA